ncbi:MAG: M23 family metallopeptidase [Candidatus Rokubacteria bacterium]|nr:M23 family metallopeptidase [Candidatus Rokubacteria bacterium]
MPDPGGPSLHSTRRQHYSLLVVRADGSRVVRVNLPRRATFVAFSLLVVGASVLGAVLGDWVQLRHLGHDGVAERGLVSEQRRALDAISRRIAEMSRDAEAWREMHGRIWEALGPDAPAAAAGAGIGGSGRPAPPRALRHDIDRLAETIAEEGENLRALDRLMARAGRALALLPSRWPVRGPVNSEFGRRLSPWTATTEFHGGVDIGAREGTPVHAAAPGTVVVAGDLGDRGIAVVVDHGQDIRTHYGHLARVSVKSGQSVPRGAVLGYTGNTGRSTGPHLHYEIVVKGRPVNPRAFLWDEAVP